MLVRPVVAAAVLACITAATPVASPLAVPLAVLTNECAPCQTISNLECGIVLLNAISHCCGMGNGNASCNTGLDPDAYAVACEGGGGCICGEWGDNCDPVG
jgi:hypothetical protein